MNYDYPSESGPATEEELVDFLDYITCFFLALFGALGIAGNLLYVVRNYPRVKSAPPIRINNIQLYALLLALFNVIFLMRILALVYEELNKDLEMWSCYLFVIIDYLGTLGVIYSVTRMASESFQLTRNEAAFKAKSSRFYSLIEGLAFLSLAAILFCICLVAIAPVWQNDYCVVADQVATTYSSFVAIVLIVGLMLSLVAYARAMKSESSVTSDVIKYVAFENLKVSVLYTVCVVFIFVLWAISGILIDEKSYYRVWIFVYNAFNILSFLCSALFPSICEFGKHCERKGAEIELVG